MARQRWNLVTGNLGADHTAAVTTITLAAALTEGGVNIPTIAAPDIAVLRIDSELVHLTAYTAGATTGTIARAKGGTVAATHTNGATVRLVEDKDEYGSVVAGWYQDNAAANQSAVVLPMANARTEVPMPADGHVVGIVVYSNAARAAGTLTVDATINGTVTGLTAVLDGSNTQTKATRQAQNLDKFAAGNRLGVKITTDAGWLPTTADIDVALLVVSNGAAP